MPRHNGPLPNQAPLPFTFEEGTIDERFAEFDREHPEVYAAFKRLALKLLRAGRKHYSSDAICHVIRFHHALAGPKRSPKIQNDFTSRYSRKLAAEDERFQSFFTFRPLKGS